MKHPIVFHGAFHSKDLAKGRKRQVHGFIKKIKIRGETRYAVMSGKPSRKFKRQLHG